MKHLLLALILFSCNSSASEDDLEDGYYIKSPNSEMSFFCRDYGWGTASVIIAKHCVDMNCNYAADSRIRSTILIREAVIMPTKGFNYKNVTCGRSK